MKILEVKDLTKNYGSFTAVKGIDFEIEKGEIFGFLGPNGAGKTTTINMLTGLARPTKGSICLSGIDCVRNIKKAQHKIGVVPDESNLYDELDGFSNLSFCASLYGIGKRQREKRAAELLKIFGLDNIGNRPFKAYSKGMKRKLTIAAGIIHNPEILFLDEPTTGIDVESARQIRKLILELNRSGKTIFLTTHYIEEAERLCHRIAFIVQGEIVKSGTVNELMNEAQKDNIVQFTVNENLTGLLDKLKNNFPDVYIETADELTVKIRSNKKIDLMPLMNFFDNNNCQVNEARMIRPTLEEVFVKVTGIETEKMKKEKERGGKK